MGAALAVAGPVRAPAPAAPDLLFFAEHLAADLERRCATCHSDPESAGRYLLQPLDDAARPGRKILLRNYRSTLAFLDPEAPAGSRLLRQARGEDGHPGGALYPETGSKNYEALLHFAMGATLHNRPPEAIAQRRYDTRVGLALRLDGTLSGDPDGDAITYHWSVSDRPAGSTASVTGGAGGIGHFEPDRSGVYRVDLAVFDGTLWSLPASAMLVAGRDSSAATTAGGVSAMDAMDATDPAGGRSGTARKPLVERRLDRDRLRLIRRLYMDLRWRSPKLEEVERWYGSTHEEMVAAFLKDVETWQAWYEQQLHYFLLLDRFRPKEGRLTTVPTRLTRGEICVPRALQEIVRSQYFNARNPGNDTFVTAVYEQILGMAVQERSNRRALELGKRMYDGYREKIFREWGDSQADLVRICFRQRDCFRHFLRRSWKTLHGTDMDRERLEVEAERLQTDPRAFPRMLEEWLTGPEYVSGAGHARTKPAIPYVRALFVDTLGRVPAYDELRNVRNAFLSLADPTPIRLVMGRVLLESRTAMMPVSAANPERFVKEQFVRLLARPATGREVEAFVAALENDPMVTPRVILWTLVSSPEYQSY